MTVKRKSTRRISQIMERISHKKRVRQITLSVIFIIIVAVFVSGSRGTYQLYQFTKKKADLEEEIKSLEKDKARLEKVKSKIENDPDYIEKIAREKYKMKKKEEKVYEVVEE
jgi:cell division protein FtsL